MSVQPFSSRFVGPLFATSALLFMFSCGGGSGRDPQPPQPLQSVAGIWNGQLSVAGSIVNDVSCLITEAGEGACVLYESATTTIVGGLRTQITVANGNQLGGSGTAYALPGYVLPDGSSTIANFTVTDGMVSARNTVELTFSILGSSGGLTVNFDPAYDRNSSLDLVAAAYSAFEINGESALFSISANGVLFSQTGSGCAMTGQVSVIDSSFNGYDISVSISSCPGLDGDYQGLAVTRDSAGTDDVFLFGVFNSTAALLGAPIRIDRPFTEITKLLPETGNAFDAFGIDLAISDNTLVVGAHGRDDTAEDSGAAYIFSDDGSGFWPDQVRINATDPQSGDIFGRYVGIDAGSVIVSAVRDDDNGNDSGSAYIFTQDASGVWFQQTKLIPDDGSGEDLFGASVAINVDTALAGAVFDNVVGLYSGSAYAFSRDSVGIWSQDAKLLPLDAEAGAWFGDSVAIQGDIAVVGASQDGGVGAVYVFERDLANNWTQTVKIVASDPIADARFGRRVNMDGQTVVVGAYGGSQPGSAYVFVRDATGTWNQQAKLTPSDGANGDWFGYVVDIDNDSAIIGARQADGIGLDSGAAYLFKRDASGIWSELSKITASDEAAGDLFGHAVAIEGNMIAIAALKDDDNGTDSGSVYIFRLNN